VKKVAPVVIVIFICGYLVAYLIALMVGMMSGVPWVAKIGLFFGGFVIVSIITALIYTLVDRLREIEREDKDDLSKY
jgi:uncharacterized membrane protein